MPDDKVPARLPAPSPAQEGTWTQDDLTSWEDLLDELREDAREINMQVILHPIRPGPKVKH